MAKRIGTVTRIDRRFEGSTFSFSGVFAGGWVGLESGEEHFDASQWTCHYREPKVGEIVEVGWDTKAQRIFAVWPE